MKGFLVLVSRITYEDDKLKGYNGVVGVTYDYGRDLLPHVHVYEWEWIKGAWRIVKRFILPW